MIYVGYKRDGTKEVFKADSEPTSEFYGGVYYSAWGPFRTMRAATFAVSWRTNGNPHTQTVADCERIAKKLAAQDTFPGRNIDLTREV